MGYSGPPKPSTPPPTKILVFFDFSSLPGLRVEFFARWLPCQDFGGDQGSTAFPRFTRENSWPYEALGAGDTDGLDDGGGASRVPKVVRWDSSSLLAFEQGQFGCTDSRLNALVQAAWPWL